MNIVIRMKNSRSISTLLPNIPTKERKLYRDSNILNAINNVTQETKQNSKPIVPNGGKTNFFPHHDHVRTRSKIFRAGSACARIGIWGNKTRNDGQPEDTFN